MTEVTAIEKLEKLDFVEIFTKTGIDNLLSEITVAAKSLILDASTQKGRDEIKSHAYVVSLITDGKIQNISIKF